MTAAELLPLKGEGNMNKRQRKILAIHKELMRYSPPRIAYIMRKVRLD